MLDLAQSVQIAEHSICPALLPETPVVLDVGARDFEFAQGILALWPRARVIALDPDPEMEEPKIQGVQFMRVALVGIPRVYATYASFEFGTGNYLTEDQEIFDCRGPVAQADVRRHQVPCVDIGKLLPPGGFDLIKLDCEGSEFEILENWPGPIARQISVEFHEWRDPLRRDDAYFSALHKRLRLLGYACVRLDLRDCLFVLE